ncbi:hypothetical protein PS685_00150 [Pseudomonas fluorescens]|uniref:Uncharacterized protein n=1 Tax=Pseudomonas fluorescens TaxID=294 RepID=A0A5E6Y954_PSEFL|nr:hypothetical protein [Pseudomonas fluorescens]VVN49986.1 hypothetical protein PS685_00150 [Pseudomonas fluorescens]
MNSFTARKWALVVSLLGLVITLSGGLLTWYASSQTTKQSAIESCIQRIDRQEQVIRKKAEVLLGSIADFGSKTAAPNVTEEVFHNLGQHVVNSSMRFTAYAPIELTGVAVQLAGTVQIGLMARTPDEKMHALQLATSAMKGWTEQYFTLMGEYEKRRSDCMN